MSFLNSSTSFTRYKVTEQVPSDFWRSFTDKLRQFAFMDIDETAEERSFGWVSFEDMLDTSFAKYPVEIGEYVAFSLRLDTRRVPPAVIKKHLALALQKEEAQLEGMGKKFISRERKKEIKEQVVLRLRMRFLPIPALFQVVWNSSTNIVYFASVQQKMLTLFEEYFIRSFNLHLEQLSPFQLALGYFPDAEALDAIEPSTFT